MSPKIKIAIKEAMSLRTSKERLQAFLELDFSGYPGVKELRARQEKVKERMARIENPARWDASEQYWITSNCLIHRKTPFRLCKFKDKKKASEMTRAMATGDDKRLVQIAEEYHKNVERLYVSKYSRVDFCRETVEEVEFLYAKSYGHPARYKVAGVWPDYEKKEIILIKTSGKEVRIPFPKE